MASLDTAREEGFQQNFVLLSSVYSVLKAGRPMLLYEELHQLFKHVKMPEVVQEHWSDNAGWEMAAALDGRPSSAGASSYVNDDTAICAC